MAPTQSLTQPAPAANPAAASALPLIVSSLAIIACSAAITAAYIVILRGHRSSGEGHSLWNNANYAAKSCSSSASTRNGTGGLDAAAAAGAIEELRDRCYSTEPSRQRRSLRQMLACGRARLMWNLPAILELAEANAAAALPSEMPPAPSGRRSARSSRSRLRFNRTRILSATTGSVHKAGGRRRRTRLEHRRRLRGRGALLSRLTEALLTNQSGLRCCSLAQFWTSGTSPRTATQSTRTQPLSASLLSTSSDDDAAPSGTTVVASAPQQRLQLVLRLAASATSRASSSAGSNSSCEQD